MSQQGPNKPPTVIRKLRGDKIEEDDLKAKPLLPVAPKSLSKEAREIWDYTLEELTFMNVLSSADRDALVCYCESVVVHRRASEILAFEGLMLEGRDGKMVKNPVVQIQKDAAQTIKMFAAEFGLTPRSRSDFNVTKEDPNDELRKLLS